MDSEYEGLVTRLRDNHQRRNQAQLFAFTASFGLLAVVIPPGNRGVDLAGALFLLPYVALVPLSCKIAYSRICHARIDAYLSAAYPRRRPESDLEKVVPDLGKGTIERIITLGVNFEPALIGFAASALAAREAFASGWSAPSIAVIAAALALPLLVIVILLRGLDYSGIRESFATRWKAVLAGRDARMGRGPSSS